MVNLLTPCLVRTFTTISRSEGLMNVGESSRSTQKLELLGVAGEGDFTSLFAASRRLLRALSRSLEKSRANKKL